MGLRRTTEKHSKQRLDGGRWSMTVLVAAMLPGCSFIFASGAPSEPITPATAQAAITDPPCTESTAWPWVDVVFTGVYSGMAAASSSGAIDMGLEGAIALLAGTAAHAFSAIHGFGKVGGCFAYMQAARTAARPVPAYVQNSPAFTGWTPAAGPTPKAIILPAFAASIPASASSITKQFSASILIRAAALIKTSG